ncbi:MAG: hypothetical protein PF693_21615 [Spirochaetia bacterium]|jgi:hypothetical protein|nr:hypothetical protein [Spirochaetia bacterium]
MDEVINMINLVSELPGRRRGRACMVLTHDYTGQKKWAEKLAEQTGSGHLNLLDYFSADQELSVKAGSVSVKDLFNLLTQQKDKDVLIVSGIEFLKAAWSGQTTIIEQFATMVSTWDKTPSLLFVIQFDKQLAEYKFTNRFQYTFLVDQKETLAL